MARAGKQVRGIVVVPLLLAWLGGCGAPAASEGDPDAQAGPDGGSPTFCEHAARGWTGAGTTHRVAAGADVQAAIDAAADGDTVELEPGTWTAVELRIDRRIRLRARVPQASILQGASAPPLRGNEASPGGNSMNGITVEGEAASGAWVEGIVVRWYGDHCFGVLHARDVTLIANRAESCDGQGYFLFDTVRTKLDCNEAYDPYLADDVPTPIDETSNADWRAHMDYGVQVYGSIDTVVRHTYLHGQFNQAISFKEGNRGYEVSDSTFDGFAGTALLLGQNVAEYGPYQVSGELRHNDTGTILVARNVFRPVTGLRAGTTVEYRAAIAITLGHLDAANVELDANTVEAAFTGIDIDCAANSAAGCPTGSLVAHHDVFGAALTDATGTRREVAYRAVSIDSGVDALTMTFHHETVVDAPHAFDNAGATLAVNVERTLLGSIGGTVFLGDHVATMTNVFPGTAPVGIGNTAVDPLFAGPFPLQLRAARRDLEPDTRLRDRVVPGDPARLAGEEFQGAMPPR